MRDQDQGETRRGETAGPIHPPLLLTCKDAVKARPGSPLYTPLYLPSASAPTTLNSQHHVIYACLRVTGHSIDHGKRNPGGFPLTQGWVSGRGGKEGTVTLAMAEAILTQPPTTPPMAPRAAIMAKPVLCSPAHSLPPTRLDSGTSRLPFPLSPWIPKRATSRRLASTTTRSMRPFRHQRCTSRRTGATAQEESSDS